MIDDPLTPERKTDGGEWTGDTELLRRYAEDRSEAAFAELVARHLGLVYAAALRQVGGAAHRAQDVAQTVFIALARQSAPLSRRTEIVGWLYTSTHHVAAKLKRTEQRRAWREQEAHAMNEINADDRTAADWDRLRPVLDAAMHGLSDAEREAILLRYFQNRRLAEVGQRLGLSEAAARMRIERALDKLQVLLGRHGITSTSAALSVALANPALAAAPAGLAATVTGAALAGVAAGAGAGGAVAATTLFMNAKTILVTAIAILAIGFSIYEVNLLRHEREAATAARAELQAQLRTAQQRADAADRQNAALQALQREAAAKQPAMPARSAASPGTLAAAPAIPGTLARGRGSAGSPLGKLPDDPVARERMIQMIRTQQNASTDSTYAALYRLQGWTEAQQSQFRDLMFESRQKEGQLFRSAMQAAREKNPNIDRAEQFEIFDAVRAQSDIENEQDARRLLGEAAGAALEHYNTTLPMRFVARQLDTALFSTSEPLSQPPTEQLIEILSANSRGPGGRAEIPALNIDAAVNAAQGLLTPAQLAELRRVALLMQEQAKDERARNTPTTPVLRLR